MQKEHKALTSLVSVIKKHEIRHVYALFSGGRDSLVALDLGRRACRGLDKRFEAVYVDTTIATPGNLEYVQSICKELDVKLSVIRPRKDFFTLVEKWGFPTVTRRWCCYHLKIEPLKLFFRNTNVDHTLVIDGIRANESPRRKTYPVLGIHKHFKCLNYHPIFNWNSRDVKIYIKKHKLRENPLYNIFPRATECWCTAFKSVKQFRLLKEYFPDLFQKFVEAEMKLKSGGSALFKNGKRIYLRNL